MDKRLRESIQECIENMKETNSQSMFSANDAAAYAAGYLYKYPELAELLRTISGIR